MKGKVFVGLSGGVDSSVAAKRLIERGYNVVGVFIKTWRPDFISCNIEAERLDAMRVAAHLDVPFLTFDAEVAYKNEVADYMIAEYKAGRTPNPDVMCNRYIKFSAFLSFALKHGATHIATGHYAQIQERNGIFNLCRGLDTEKDQSYFIWTLTQEQLAHILFPIGDSLKSEIRDEAKRAGLYTFEKKDSQGICFLGKIDIQEFLSHYIKSEVGNVFNEKNEIIGTHPGALFFTLGQRHGFTVNILTKDTVPLYVIGKNILSNTITVATQPLKSSGQDFALSDCINHGIKTGDSCDVQFRYRQKPLFAKIKLVTDTSIRLSIPQASETPSPGQSCVLYQGQVCVGGGIIQTLLEQNRNVTTSAK